MLCRSGLPSIKKTFGKDFTYRVSEKSLGKETTRQTICHWARSRFTVLKTCRHEKRMCPAACRSTTSSTRGGPELSWQGVKHADRRETWRHEKHMCPSAPIDDVVNQGRARTELARRETCRHEKHMCPAACRSTSKLMTEWCGPMLCGGLCPRANVVI
jgi:hypothetical protein